MRITLTLPKELAERYELLAGVTNRTVGQVAKHALSDWMDISGEAELEVITGIPAPDVKTTEEPQLLIPAAASA